MAFDARAMHNIATAPATRADRLAAAWTAFGFAVALLPAVIFRGVQGTVTPAFVPAVVSAETVALAVTAIILYLQYRVARDGQLAIIAYAYVWSAACGVAYLLAFPGVFTPGGIAGAHGQASSYLYVAQHAGLAVLIGAFAVIDRRRARPSRATVRRIGIAVAAVFALTLIVTSHVDVWNLPRATVGLAFTPLWVWVVIPSTVLVLAAALALLVRSASETVTQVWLLVATAGWALSIAASTLLSATRYSLPWYEARIVHLGSDLLVLAIFLAKLTGLLERLATTSVESESRYRALTDAVPQLLFTTDAAGTVEDVNGRWTAYTGLDRDATRAGGLREIFHPERSPAARDQWLHALATGDGFEEEVRVRDTRTGRDRWFLAIVVPQRGLHGRVVRWIGSLTDIDAGRRLEERDAFLARAAERLGASLDVAAVLAATKALVVPRLADRCEVELLDDDGRYVLAAVGSSDLGTELAARASLGRVASPEDAERLGRIAEAGGPVADESRRDRVAVGLRAGGEPVGVLGVERARPFEPDDVGLLADLARRAAVSLRHARVYERERSTADALQRAMLPQHLPQDAAIRFSASYSAASESQRVGGDFYDAFELPDGRVAMAIGDVTGHGLEAAVIMGEIRQAIRASSFERAEPAAILDRASRLLVASGRSVFVTAVFGVLDPRSGAFVYATAGHPAPLLTDGTTVRRLSAAGLPLGLRDGDGVEFGLTLREGETVMMFTDGLLEFRRDLDDAEQRIDAALVRLGGDGLDHLAGALMKDVLGDDEPTDDIAILTATIGVLAMPSTDDVRTWRFTSADAAVATTARRDAAAAVEAWDGAETRFGVELALGELLANVVRHAPGTVAVRLALDADRATLTVDDRGAGFGEIASDGPALAESGRGLALVRAFARDLRVEPAPDGGARVVVTFDRRAVSASGRCCTGAVGEDGSVKTMEGVSIREDTFRTHG